jgi:hypothetical protein
MQNVRAFQTIIDSLLDKDTRSLIQSMSDKLDKKITSIVEEFR